MLKLTVDDVREVPEDLVQVQRLDEVMRDVEGVAVAEERVELVAIVATSEDDDEEVGGDVQHGEDSETDCGKSLEIWFKALQGGTGGQEVVIG